MQIILCRKVVVVVVKERKWGAKGNAQLGMWEMEAKKFALIRVCVRKAGLWFFLVSVISGAAGTRSDGCERSHSPRSEASQPTIFVTNVTVHVLGMAWRLWLHHLARPECCLGWCSKNHSNECQKNSFTKECAENGFFFSRGPGGIPRNQQWSLVLSLFFASMSCLQHKDIMETKERLCGSLQCWFLGIPPGPREKKKSIFRALFRESFFL